MKYFKNIFKEVILHSLKVSWYNLKNGIFEQVGFKNIVILFLAGLFHDLGKLKINKNILFKKGYFSNEERKEVNKHSIYSMEIVDYYLFFLPQEMLMEIKYIIRYLHEEEYIFKNRLLLITYISDNYDALKSERAYKESFNEEQTINIIQNNLKRIVENTKVHVFWEHDPKKIY